MPRLSHHHGRLAEGDEWHPEQLSPSRSVESRRRPPPNPRKARKHRESASPDSESSCSASTGPPWLPSDVEQPPTKLRKKKEKAFEKRARHKTRSEKYEYRAEAVGTTKQKDRRQTGRPRKKTGHVLNESFRAPNVSQVRLTLNHPNGPGIFHKGRASAEISSSGLPDLTFSEMKFLKRPRETVDEEHRLRVVKRKEEDRNRRKHLMEYFEQGVNGPSSGSHGSHGPHIPNLHPRSKLSRPRPNLSPERHSHFQAESHPEFFQKRYRPQSIASTYSRSPNTLRPPSRLLERRPSRSRLIHKEADLVPTLDEEFLRQDHNPSRHHSQQRHDQTSVQPRVPSRPSRRDYFSERVVPPKELYTVSDLKELLRLDDLEWKGTEAAHPDSHAPQEPSSLAPDLVSREIYDNEDSLLAIRKPASPLYPQTSHIPRPSDQPVSARTEDFRHAIYSPHQHKTYTTQRLSASDFDLVGSNFPVPRVQCSLLDHDSPYPLEPYHDSPQPQERHCLVPPGPPRAELSSHFPSELLSDMDSFDRAVCYAAESSFIPAPLHEKDAFVDPQSRAESLRHAEIINRVNPLEMPGTRTDAGGPNATDLVEREVLGRENYQIYTFNGGGLGESLEREREGEQDMALGLPGFWRKTFLH